MLRTIYIFTLALLLLSCAGTNYVQPDVSTPKALVRIISQDNIITAAVFYDDPSCKVGPHSGLLGAPGGDFGQDLITSRKIPEYIHVHGNTQRMISPPNISDLSYIERTVPAGKEVAFVFVRTASRSSLMTEVCNMTVTFTPDQNGQYELSFYVDHHAEKKCTAALNRLSPLEKANGTDEAVRTPQKLRVLDKSCSLL